MNRDEMVTRGVDALHEAYSAAPGRPSYYQTVRAILDAVLPQVTTVEELEALPFKALLVDSEGLAIAVAGSERMGLPGPEKQVFRFTSGRIEFSASRIVRENGPLTVVWSPS